MLVRFARVRVVQLHVEERGQRVKPHGRYTAITDNRRALHVVCS